MMMRFVLLALFVSSILALPLPRSAIRSTQDFPLFKQCDRAWAQNEMGVDGPGERASICREGCAMSCVAMALNGYNITIDGQASNPGTLNEWLEKNSGYLCLAGDCNNLVLDAPTRLAAAGKMALLGEKQKPSMEDLDAMILAQKYAMVAHVRNNHHFVLLTGLVDGNYTVNDPGYDVTSVMYSEISDIITYSFE